MNFKPNSTLQNYLVYKGLHPLIYYKLTLSLVNIKFLTYYEIIPNLILEVNFVRSYDRYFEGIQGDLTQMESIS